MSSIHFSYHHHEIIIDTNKSLCLSNSCKLMLSYVLKTCIDHELFSILYVIILSLSPIENCISISKVRAPNDNLANIPRNYLISYLINKPINDGELESTLFDNL